MKEMLLKTGDFTTRELECATPHELFELWCDYEGLIGYADKILCALEDCGYSVGKSEPEMERFFSVKQIEEYFIPRLDGMTNREIKDFLVGYCREHKVVCCGNTYTADNLYEMFVAPDFDPTHGLEYLGF